MELKYLQTLKTITEAGSFAAAAKRLNYTQSTVTFHIQQLEKTMHVALFEKIGRRMVLTQAGHSLMPYVDNILNNMAQLEAHGNDLSEPQGTLRVTAAESLLTYKLPPIIREFQEAAPTVQLSLRSADCNDMEALIMNGETDLCIHYDIGIGNTAIVADKLADFPLVLVGSPALDAQARDLTTPHQQKDLCFLCDSSNSLYKQALWGTLAARDILLKNHLVMGSISAITQCVLNGLASPFFRNLPWSGSSAPVNSVPSTCRFPRSISPPFAAATKTNGCRLPCGFLCSWSVSGCCKTEGQELQRI